MPREDQLVRVLSNARDLRVLACDATGLVEEACRRLNALPPTTTLLREGLRPEEILACILGEIPYEVLEKRPLRFGCSCNKERVERALLSLGPQELRRYLGGEGGARIACEFCRSLYLLSKEDIQRLLEEAGEGKTRH